MRGRRTGQLTDEETWRAVYEEGIKPAAVAAFEGISTQGVYMRLGAERKRRSAGEVDAAERTRDRLAAETSPESEAVFAGLVRAMDALTARLAGL